MARNERVTRVIDGDTFRTANRRNPVSLAGLHAPEIERQMPLKGSSEVKPPASKTVGRSTERAVAHVWIDGQSVNTIMRNITRRRKR